MPGRHRCLKVVVAVGFLLLATTPTHSRAAPVSPAGLAAFSRTCIQQKGGFPGVAETLGRLGWLPATQEDMPEIAKAMAVQRNVSAQRTTPDEDGYELALGIALSGMASDAARVASELKREFAEAELLTPESSKGVFAHSNGRAFALGSLDMLGSTACIMVQGKVQQTPTDWETAELGELREALLVTHQEITQPLQDLSPDGPALYMEYLAKTSEAGPGVLAARLVVPRTERVEAVSGKGL